MRSMMLVEMSLKQGRTVMPSNQSDQLVVDMDDEPTNPRIDCLPTKLISIRDLPSSILTSNEEDYYRHLSEALDAALNL